ncbi:MAG: two-component system sensor histidine kinase/response regulator [Flavobacteriales bacterium]|jgi:two-component system sensor histidine kinase/response regulator
MDKFRNIRFKNTLLAASGGIVLTLILIFSYRLGNLWVDFAVLDVLLTGFWCVNGLVVVSVAFGWSERFKDPSLSVPQMYWATTCCFISLSLLKDYQELVYFLLFVIMVFGVFQLYSALYKYYAAYAVLGQAYQFYYSYEHSLVERSPLELVFVWFTFSCCVLILTLLCRSMTALRKKLRKKNNELNAALNAKAEFLANMSHEIRTPMNGVIGMLELLDKTKLDSGQEKYLNIARASGKTLVGLINDILDFSKVDAGKLTLDVAEFQLRQSILELCHGFYYIAKQKNIELIVDLDPSFPDVVKGDEVRICQVFNNLIGNALKFTAEGRIVVKVRAELCATGISSYRIVGSVNDTGVGIDRESLEKIFDAFSQEDARTTRQFGGTGLGLSIVKQICELMGGDVNVESIKGLGSKFTFNLIVGEGDHKNEAVSSYLREKKNYVLIEDDECYEAMITRYVEYLGGSIQCVKSEGLKIDTVLGALELGCIGAVIVNERLSDRSGLDIVSVLYRLPAMNNIPIFLFCSDASGVKSIKGLVALEKPISFQIFYNGSRKLNLLDASPIVDSTAVGSIASNTRLNTENSRLVVNIDDHKSKILLVEDNLTNQEVAVMLLEDCGVEVDVAENGQVALDMLALESADYKMIFMDCQMPVLDGYQTSQKIREGAAGINKSMIPIIALTANALAGDREKCIAAGMDDYVTKPINYRTIEDCLDKWLK